MSTQIQLRERASYSYCARSWSQQTNPSRKKNSIGWKYSRVALGYASSNSYASFVNARWRMNQLLNFKFLTFCIILPYINISSPLFFSSSFCCLTQLWNFTPSLSSKIQSQTYDFVPDCCLSLVKRPSKGRRNKQKASEFWVSKNDLTGFVTWLKTV